MLETRDVRRVLALAKNKTFWETIRTIGVSQSGITSALGKVEQFFGRPIFAPRQEGRKRIMNPTVLGDKLLTGLELALKDWEVGMMDLLDVARTYPKGDETLD